MSVFEIVKYRRRKQREDIILRKAEMEYWGPTLV